jgi:hypothetical protein
MGGQGDGASYTINLDTSAHTVEETAPGNYRIPTLSPTIDVPYAAVQGFDVHSLSQTERE